MHKEESISQLTLRNILNRDFALGFLAYFAFLSTNTALYPTLPIYLGQLGSSAGQIGILVGAIGVASLICRPFVGGILVKYSEKNVIMVGAALSVLAFLTFTVFRHFWPLLIVRFVQGISLACVDTAIFVSVVSALPLAYRGQGISYLMLAPSLSTAIAPSLSVFVVSRYSFTTLFLSCAGLSTCTLLCAWKLKGREDKRPAVNDPALNTHLFEWNVVVPAIVIFLQYFIWGTIIAFLPLYAVQRGIANPGIFFSASAIMIMLGRALGGRVLNAFSQEKIILTFTFTGAVALVVLFFTKTLLTFIFVGLLWGAGISFLIPVSMAYALDYAGSSSGTAVGTLRAISDLGLALGPIIMGSILFLTGYRAMFLCLAFLCLVSLGYFQLYVRKKHDARKKFLHHPRA
ncbi:MAG: MFS transporter [Syntrophorhabdaceae bacterium]|nr:MFS transporter [Syntrophorhabdaceae bacterium]MDD5243325.1 MFS transporter [Syntrophorhabdaceae bacterium]